ncbi:N-acyl-D-amino-acid deacylase [Streptomyces antnestii]|uniref:N-acyl-D-amino-acid deacylase n=1 Tax=Streptomyces antnestii TaxID=2494256 RepID=A0A3S2VE48_9ACTN|nr:amidohydrolase family protein [Streptomyces sp. San01]RVU22392.1 N-acyl-D-amino-acid deacylase [Streptomyces sp. San01]
MTQLILRQARVEQSPSVSDVVIDGGRVRAVGDASGLDADEVIDCAGRVVLPGFVEPHLHLDKALLDSVRPNPDGTLAGAIAVTGELKAAFTYDDVRARARRVLEAAVLNGTTVIRAHPDVDPIAGLLGVEVLLELREEYREVVDLQIVAFPQEGVLRSPGTEKLLVKALAAGADVIGGCTYNEATLDDCHRHVRLVLDLAARHGVPADLHADFADDATDPRYALAEFIAGETARRGLGGRVTLGHMTSLGGRAPEDRARAMAALADAGVAVVPLPATDLHLSGRRDTHAVRRGIAPVRELWDHGVLAACSSNNIRNAFTPFGRADPLDTALLLAQTGHLSGPADLHRVLRMVTHDAARVVGIADDYGVRPGARADLVVLDTQIYDDIVLDRPERAQVVKAGKVVARTSRTSELLIH